MQDSVEVAIGYASRQLRPRVEKYPPIQKECLAVVWGIRYFHQYLYGQPNFEVITDHCPLKWLRSMSPNNHMLQCWVCDIQQYSSTVKHRAGKLHGNADGFSRCPITSSLESEEDCCSGWITVNAISTEQIGELQDGDPYLRAMKEYLTDKVLRKGENLANRVKAYHERYELQDKVLYHIWIPKCKQSKGRTRKQLVVPPKERGKLLVHDDDDVGHPGFQRTLARLQENYFWVSMKNDVARHVRNCRACAQRKSPKNMKRAPLYQIEVTWPLEIVSVDFVDHCPQQKRGISTS